jgi:SAM-dependent methyltransferase
MERAEWLKQMRGKAEEMYDHLSPQYWVTFGLYANETHRAYLQKFLERVPPHSTLLSAACGAGRYDGMLLDAGHSLVGIDQSAGMLARARERFPGVRYEKIGLQEMNFREAFEGAICMDAMEHVCPEDWSEVLRGFWEALKPGGVLYFTVELPEANVLEEAYEQAKSRGLPVVFGELASDVDLAYERVKASGGSVVSGELASKAVYHYYPSLEQVRRWIGEAGLALEDEGTGNGYEHFVVRKR